MFSVVILNYNGRGYLASCVRSVLMSDYPAIEVIVVDNASTDGSVETLRDEFGGDARLTLIRNTSNLFFAGGNNAGMRAAKGDYIVVLNNDTEVEKDWLKHLAAAMQSPAVGACQPKMMFYDQPTLIDNVGGLIDRFGYTHGKASCQEDRGQYDASDEIFFAGGAALAVKKSVLDEVGLFDEDFALHWEDVDLCWRIRLRGYSVRSVPLARVYHKISLTFKQLGEQKNILASYHIRKNRIAGLIKNYGWYNLARSLPVLLFVYSALFFKELCVDRKYRLAFASLSALWWNVRHLPLVLRKRSYVQKRIRVVPDAEIVRQMHPGFLFLKPCGKRNR